MGIRNKLVARSFAHVKTTSPLVLGDGWPLSAMASHFLDEVDRSVLREVVLISIRRQYGKSAWGLSGTPEGSVAKFKIKNPRSKLRGIGGRKEADQKNAASCGEYVPKEI
jgi:hypothetical protein